MLSSHSALILPALLLRKTAKGAIRPRPVLCRLPFIFFVWLRKNAVREVAPKNVASEFPLCSSWGLIINWNIKIYVNFIISQVGDRSLF